MQTYTRRAVPPTSTRTRWRFGSKRRFDANLQKVRITERGAPKRVYVCTRCLKSNKVTKHA